MVRCLNFALNLPNPSFDTSKSYNTLSYSVGILCVYSKWEYVNSFFSMWHVVLIGLMVFQITWAFKAQQPLLYITCKIEHVRYWSKKTRFLWQLISQQFHNFLWHSGVLHRIKGLVSYAIIHSYVITLWLNSFMIYASYNAFYVSYISLLDQHFPHII